MSDKQIRSPLDLLAEIDNVDLSKVETSYPHLATGNVTFNITDAKITQDDDKPEKPYFLINYALAQDWRTQPFDGIPSKTVAPGARGSEIQQRIYFGYYEDKNHEEQVYGIPQYAQLREAALGRAEPGAKINPSELIGQTVTLKLKFNPAPTNKEKTETYGARTEIDGYVRKAPAKVSA